MTLLDQHIPVVTWTEPEGIVARGTLVVIPGRGERGAHYERFGRRVAADGYRVHAVTDPTVDAALTAEHAQEMQKLVPVFEALYVTMSDSQKHVADQVFRADATHGAPARHS